MKNTGMAANMHVSPSQISSLEERTDDERMDEERMEEERTDLSLLSLIRASAEFSAAGASKTSVFTEDLAIASRRTIFRA